MKIMFWKGFEVGGNTRYYFALVCESCEECKATFEKELSFLGNVSRNPICLITDIPNEGRACMCIARFSVSEDDTERILSRLSPKGAEVISWGEGS